MATGRRDRVVLLGGRCAAHH